MILCVHCLIYSILRDVYDFMRLLVNALNLWEIYDFMRLLDNTLSFIN
jgi:hypothetical protein